MSQAKSRRRTPPAKVWLFDPDAMVLGDIVFERGSNASSAFIATATGGRFSHAMIWVGGDFIEAMPDGVRSLSYARVPVCVPGNWLLLRAKPEHIEVAARAADQARGMVFKGYDLDGAIGTVIGPRKRADPTTRFCSQLVAEAYERAGLELLPGKRPEMIHPNMLSKIRTHERYELPLIDSEALLSGPYPKGYLDRSEGFRSSGMRKEANISRALYLSVEGLLNTMTFPPGFEQPGNLGEILECLPLLPPPVANLISDELLKAMMAEGYFHLLIPPMEDLLRRVTTAPRWQSQVAGWSETRQRHLLNAAASARSFAATRHPIWGALRAMYLENASWFEALMAKARGEEPD